MELVELVSYGAEANLAEGPGPFGGAEVSGPRSMVQGAATGSLAWSAGLCLIRGCRPSVSSFFLRWQREGLMGMGIQVGKRA